jgi:RNA polymerase sigma factor (sigma-70 family)
MTGSAADADDLVQDCFVRALSHRPDSRESLRPWLARVLVNLGRDALRRRRRRAYVGTWLPEPIESEPELDPAVASELSAEARLALAESARLAFLVALEALTPTQRAVLLLRDVVELSTREVAEALELSESNAKVCLHRARRALAEHEARRAPNTPDRHAEALGQLLLALAQGDAEALERLLAAEVVAHSDGGGVYSAALRPIVGRARVARFFLAIAEKAGPVVGAELRTLNGRPCLVVERAPSTPREAPRVVMGIELDVEGRVAEIHSVLAPAKLARLAPR